MPTVEQLLGPRPINTNDPVSAAKANGIDPKLFSSLVMAESGGNPNAVSSKGAVGAAQELPASAAQPGYGLKPGNPRDLNTNAAYFKKMIELAGGDIPRALRMYKQGPNGTLNTKSADAYVNKIMAQWKPDAGTLLGPRPKEEQGEAQSPIAKSPQAINAPVQQQKPPPIEGEKGIVEAINRPADRTVELMKESTQNTFNSLKALVKHPGVATATNAALNVIGLPFAPITAATQAFIGDPAKQAAHSMGVSPKADPLIDMAAQLAVPVAATRSATMQAAMGPAGKFLLGVADTYSERIAAGKGAAAVSAELTGLQGKAEASKMQWLDAVQKMVPPNYKDMAPEIAHNIETKGAHPLSPEAKAFKEQYIDPALKQTEAMAKQLTSLTGQKPKWLDNYYPRNVKPDGKADSVPGIVDVRVPQDTKALKTSPGELQDRSAGVVHDPVTGEDAAYVTDPRTGDKLIMKNKQVIDRGTLDTGVINGGTGTKWQASTGTMRDIEQHTHLSYTKDPIADVAKANHDVYVALANAQAVERLKVTPEFLSQARGPHQDAPSTWRDVGDFATGTHQLDGWKVSPRIQEVLNDFQKQHLGEGIDGLAAFNKVVVGSLFINPFAHIMNVAWHGWVEKGLVSPGSILGGVAGGVVGGVPGAVAGAAAGSLLHSPREVKALYTAMKAVSTHDENYMRYLKDGAGLMYASRYTRDFFNKTLQMTGSAEAKPAIRALGFGNVKDAVASIYAGAGNTMWWAGDIIMMQGYLANESRLAATGMKGMAPGAIQRQAMRETEKHIPNYNVPSRIGPTALELVPGGAKVERTLAQLMQGRMGLMRFGRYDYGRLASYTNMMRDTIAGMHGVVTGEGGRMASAGDALKAMNQMAALGFGAMVMYPMVLDQVTQAITGNKNASWQRYGPFTVPSLVYNYMTGKQDWKGVAASMFPLGPIPLVAVEQIYNRDLFTGDTLGLPEGEFRFLGSQISPAEDLMRIREGKITPKDWLYKQFGIKNPSAAQVAKSKAFFAKEQKAHEKWLKGHQ